MNLEKLFENVLKESIYPNMEKELDNYEWEEDINLGKIFQFDV